MTEKPFKKNAKDGDSDGIVQDGTPFMRPESVKGNFDKVAIFSTRSVYWPGVGRVVRGYNIVSSSKVDEWLTRNHVRIATPEEVAREYGI